MSIAKIQIDIPIGNNDSNHLEIEADTEKCYTILKENLKTSEKIAGLVTLNFLLCFSITVAIIEKDLNFSCRNPMILSASNFCYQYIAEPTMATKKILFQNTPDIVVKGQHVSQLFISSVLEECYCRGLIQRKILPTISKILPKMCGKIVNHQISRVALSSILFGLAHQSMLYTPIGILPQLIGGILYGAAAESENSLFVPIMTHFFSNILFGAGENP